MSSFISSTSTMADEVAEQVDLDLNISEVRYQRAEFAAVVFHNIAETYPADAHVECQYTITKDLIPSTRDWIGLYKVGWMRVEDQVYYEWAPYPENYETGKEAKGHVLFQGRCIIMKLYEQTVPCLFAIVSSLLGFAILLHNF